MSKEVREQLKKQRERWMRERELAQDKEEVYNDDQFEE